MSAPNINSPTRVEANNASAYLSDTNATQLITNASGSGKTMLVDSITVANIDNANAVTVVVALYKSATNTGTAYDLAPTVSVPANASLIAVDTSQKIKLLEGQSIYVTAGTANKLKINAFWLEVS
jgi:hypothetical protein